MKPYFLALLTLLCAAAALSAPPAEKPEPDVVITFRAEAEVKSGVILLSDVATIEGADGDLVAALEAVEVGAAPLSGHKRSVSAAYAKIRIRQINVRLARILFNGPQTCTVVRPEQIVTGAQLEKIACEAVDAANPGVSAQVAFTPADVRIPLGNVELKPQGVRLFGGTSGTVAVQVLVDGRQEATTTVSFRLLRRAPAVIAARDLPVGTVLTEEDLRVEERPVVAGPLVISDAALAVGQAVSVPVKGGTVITAAMLKPAIVIKRGTRVKLVCSGGAFKVTTAGEALQDATAGQPVRVRNLTSLLEVTGIATAPQTVEVPF